MEKNYIFMGRLRDLRDELNLTAVDLGKLIGVKQGAISSWENGRTFPNHKYLVELAKTFNVSTDYLLGFSEIKSYSNNANISIAETMLELNPIDRELVITIINRLINKDLDK